jgi:hypothetical protein
MTMPSVPARSTGFSKSALGFNSMPTETKNRKANASRSGSASVAARSE